MERRRPPLPALVPLLAFTVAACAPGDGDSAAAGDGDRGDVRTAAPGAGDAPACDPDDGGLELPDGFCALVVARDLGRVRHLAVTENGDLYAALRDSDQVPGGVLALRDTSGDGRVDMTRRLARDMGGTGMELHQGHLHYGRDDAVLRWERPEGVLAPEGDPTPIVRELRASGGHAAKPLAFDGEGNLYVNVGSPSNACQELSRTAGSPGQDPCPQLERNAGVWRFAADRAGQTQSDGQRFATGMRNAVALGHNPVDGHLYAAIHGRDQLDQLWPDHFTREERAEKPSEEFVRVTEGADFGWPYCHHDPELDRKVLAPEYGGDGRQVGRCAAKADPLLAFPAHWGPNDLVFYTASRFPERYRGGAFLAFHGSWNRAPLPQEGYRVVFVPFEDGEPTGEWSDFATGFRREGQGPREADHRPTGLAVGPDGSIYVSDDQAGWIWRIVPAGS